MFFMILFLYSCSLFGMNSSENRSINSAYQQQINDFECAVRQGNVAKIKELCEQQERVMRAWLQSNTPSYFHNIINQVKSGMVLDHKNIQLSLMTGLLGLFDVKSLCRYFTVEDDEYASFDSYAVFGSTLAMVATIGYIKYRSHNMRKDLIEKLVMMRCTGTFCHDK
jgi:hypothetical protein